MLTNIFIFITGGVFGFFIAALMNIAKTGSK